MRTAVIAMVSAVVTGVLLTMGPVGAAGNPPVVNPLDINPFLVARANQPCSSNGSSVPLVGEAGQFYECKANKWVAVPAFAERRMVGETQLRFTTTPAVAPPGWLLTNGAAFNATTYPQLAAALGGNTLPTLGPPAGAQWIIRAIP